MPSPESLSNVFSIMVDDYTNRWYHQKNKEDRIALLSEVRSFLTARRLSEIDKNPELSTLKAKRENAMAKLQELERTTSGVRAELTAWEHRINEIEKQRNAEEDLKLESAKKKARALKKNRLFSQVVGR
jgi:uncharacterized protein involved in exopolysaccharide biosynthesis